MLAAARSMMSQILWCQMLRAPDHMRIQLSISGLLGEEVADIASVAQCVVYRCEPVKCTASRVHVPHVSYWADT